MRQHAETWDDCLSLALKAWREERGLTGVQCAERAKVSQSAWSRWETGEAPVNLTVLLYMGILPETLIRRARDIAFRDGVTDVPLAVSDDP